MRRSLHLLSAAAMVILFISGVVAQEWSGPKFDAREGDPYSQGWIAQDCKHVQYDAEGNVVDNGADQVQPFGCYDGEPFLSPEYMSVKKAYGIDVLHVDYRVYLLPTWQTLVQDGCAGLNTVNAQMKTECRAHHNYRQSFKQSFDDADDEWEGFTITWMARAEDLPGNIGMRVKAYAGIPAGEENYTSAKVLSGFEARYGCVDPDNDIFGPDNLVVRSDPDPATGHDYVTQFPDDNGSDRWHIYRIAVEVGDTCTTSMCRIYLDENPNPVIVTAHAKPEKGSIGNYIHFGVGGWNMPKVASMAWVLSTTEGAYGPDELPIPEDFMEIYNTARSFQEVTFVQPEGWEGPLYDARYGDPYSQGWLPHDCKHADLDLETGLLKDNGADSVAAFGCYNVDHPALSKEYMSVLEEDGIQSLHVDYRVYSLPTWQSITSCADLNTVNAQMKTECRAHHNYRQSFRQPLDDADDEWEGYTIVWLARAEMIPGVIGMRVKAYAGLPAGEENYTSAKVLSGFEARYGCVDPDNDIFGPDNLVVRSDPDPATGHDYVTEFPADNGSDWWHIYRIAVEVGDTCTTSMCRIYLDENPEPVIVTAQAKPEKGSIGNYIHFGVGGWNMPKVASMGWVLSTTEGAYGPDERPIPADYMQIYNTARSNYAAGVEYRIEKEDSAVPKVYTLEQNYPNPFNASTSIRYQLEKTSKVFLTVHNVNGQFITTLVNRKQEPGTYRVIWDGTDIYGVEVPSGTYVYVLKTPNYTEAKKMILVK